MNKDIEDLRDRLDCVHQVNEAVGANLKYYKSQNKELKHKLNIAINSNNSLWDDYWDVLDEFNNQFNKIQKLKRENQSLNDKNKNLKKTYQKDLDDLIKVMGVILKH